MFEDGLLQVGCAAVMQEETTLPNAPEGRSAEHVAGGLALRDVICQALSHVVDQQIAIEVRRYVLQRLRFALRGCHHSGGMAENTAYAGIGRISPKQLLSTLRAGGERNGLGSIKKASKEGENQPVSVLMFGIEEALVALVGVIKTRNVIGFTLIGEALRSFVGSLRKEVIGDAHLHVVGLGGKDTDGLVLRLPAEAGD